MSSKKTILFDANPIIDDHKSGVGYYTHNLIDQLNREFSDQIQLIGHYFNFLGKKQSLNIAGVDFVESKIFHPKLLSLCRKFGFQPPLELFFKKLGDLVLFTNFVSLPSVTKLPIYVAVHDLCYEDMSGYVSDKNQRFLHKFVPRSIKNAKKVITISESTKKAIKKHYEVADEKIIITPIPPTAPVFKPKNYLKKFNIKDKYILFVSTLEPRKNFLNLVKAYEKLPSRIKNEYSLVLAGGQGWKIDEGLNYIKKSQKTNDIILTGYVSDNERAALYTNASLFVMPSHYEGFGMPILEAMSYKIPTAVSDIRVFHEVAADASVYFDQNNPSDIAKKINSILDNKELSSNLIKQGIERLKKYSWEKVVTDLYNQIKNDLEKR